MSSISSDPDANPDAEARRPASSDNGPVTELGRLRKLWSWTVIRLNLAILYVYAAAASAIGVDALTYLLGVGAHWPVALPVTLLALAVVGVYRQRRRRRPGSAGDP